MAETGETLLTTREAAAYLGVHEETVREGLREGRLPGVRLGRRWRVPRLALAEWLDRRTQSGEPVKNDDSNQKD